MPIAYTAHVVSALSVRELQSTLLSHLKLQKVSKESWGVNKLLIERFACLVNEGLVELSEETITNFLDAVFHNHLVFIEANPYQEDMSISRELSICDAVFPVMLKQMMTASTSAAASESNRAPLVKLYNSVVQFYGRLAFKCKHTESAKKCKVFLQMMKSENILPSIDTLNAAVAAEGTISFENALKLLIKLSDEGVNLKDINLNIFFQSIYIDSLNSDALPKTAAVKLDELQTVMKAYDLPIEKKHLQKLNGKNSSKSRSGTKYNLLCHYFLNQVSLLLLFICTKVIISLFFPDFNLTISLLSPYSPLTLPLLSPYFPYFPYYPYFPYCYLALILPSSCFLLFFFFR